MSAEALAKADARRFFVSIEAPLRANRLVGSALKALDQQQPGASPQELCKRSS
jgi:hypothetical protein